MKEERCILIVDDDRESIHLTEKDGGDVAAQIEADPGMQRTPIIFLTALVTRAEAKAGVHIEGHPVAAKPINIPDLTKRIEENIPAITSKGVER